MSGLLPAVRPKHEENDMINLEKAKQTAAEQINAGVLTPRGKRDTKKIAQIHKALTEAHIAAGCTDAVEAGNHSANFIMNRC